MILSNLFVLPPALADDREQVFALVARIEAAEAQLQDSTYTLEMQEYVDGHLKDKEVMTLKYRRPHEVMLTWVGEVNTGRELLYRQGWNDGDLRVNPGRFLPTLNLDPLGKVATAESRHSVLDSGVPFAVGKIIADTWRVRDAPERHGATFTWLGSSQVSGRAVSCYEAHLPKAQDPAFYATKAKVCAYDDLHLPASFEVWDVEDGSLRMVERFLFADLQVNVGLTDHDFDPDNPAYGF